MQYLVSAMMLLPALIYPRLAPGADSSFRVAGAVEHPRAWTAAGLAKELPGSVEVVRYSMQGTEHEARCVPLWAVVDAAGLRLDPARKMHHVAFGVFVRARDGYTVCFSEGELDPNLGNRPVWIAFEVDGKALPEMEGPVRLLVPGEGKGHLPRWVYGVSAITVVDGAAAEPPSGGAGAAR